MSPTVEEIFFKRYLIFFNDFFSFQIDPPLLRSFSSEAISKIAFLIPNAF